MKLGVITDCFKKTHEEGIKKAAELKLDGVQIYATTGEFSPELSKEQKAQVSHRALALNEVLMWLKNNYVK